MTIQLQYFGIFIIEDEREFIDYLDLDEDFYLDLVSFNQYDEDGPVPIINLSIEDISKEGFDYMQQTKLGYDRFNFLIQNEIIKAY